MGRDIRLVPAASPEWTEWLAGVPHDFYHTAAYHLFSQQCGEGKAFLAVYGDRTKFLVWPYLLRPVADCAGLEDAPFSDVASVYGYPGPLVGGGADDPAFLSSAWSALVALWRSQEAVCAFTRFHPVIENHAWLSHLTSATARASAQTAENDCGLVPSGQTVSIDLTLSDQDNLREYQKVLRQEIARGRRLGLVTTDDAEWKHLDDFIVLYHRTMLRNHASSQYFFSSEYFQRLRAALDNRVHLLVTTLEERVAAAGLFVEYEGLVQAHLAGSSEELRALSPLKVLLDDVRRWGRERGDRIFHLGGGRAGKDDSLLAFKGRFSPRRHEFFVGKWVLDPKVYRALCEQRSLYAQRAEMFREDDQYFPQYRAALRHLSEAPDTTTAVT